MQKKYFFDKQYAGGVGGRWVSSKSYLLPSFIFLIYAIKTYVVGTY